MPTEALLPYASNPFVVITDFNVPASWLVIGLAEFDDTEDLAYIYKSDGTFIESAPGVPRDVPIEHFNHTMFTRVGGNIYGIDGGKSNFDVYKNGVGFIKGSGTANRITNHGKTLWVTYPGSAIASYNAVSGAALSSKSFSEDVSYHRTNGTHHIRTAFTGSFEGQGYLFRHMLSDMDFNNEIMLAGRGAEPPEDATYLDVAINSDRAAGVIWNSSLDISTIHIYDFSGTLTASLVNAGQAEMLLMNEDRVFASDWNTGIVTMWDITEVAGSKVYTPAGSFNTPSPYVWHGNLAT